MKRKAAIIAYDIKSDKQRRQLFSVLKKWQLAAQYSVFECSLTNAEAEELFLQLTSLMDEETDSLLLAWLDKSREPKALTSGSSTSFKIPLWYIG